jgi:hypothetical protein
MCGEFDTLQRPLPDGTRGQRAIFLKNEATAQWKCMAFQAGAENRSAESLCVRQTERLRC